MMVDVNIGSRVISANSKPYIIAEIGVNHEGSMEQAKKLIELAKDGGADAAKFQSYKAGTLASKHSPAYWDRTEETADSQYELFKRYDCFEPNDYVELAEYCKKIGIDFLSTPFDDAAVDFLEPIMPFFKIASADLTNVPFLRKIAKKGKPVVLSTGASTLDEIDNAVKTLESSGCSSLVLLHCVLNYPTENKNAALGMIKGLMRAYPQKLIGYSDHTLPDETMLPLVSAHLMGAVVLEKHFTHDKTLPGNDHYHAMDVHDLKQLRVMLDKIHVLSGEQEEKASLDSEEIARKNARRSIVLKKDVIGGSYITEEDITYKRPGHGISPLYWDNVLGRKVKHTLKEDHLLSWEDLMEPQCEFSGGLGKDVTL
jgi:sialic acid synthase SpsE